MEWSMTSNTNNERGLLKSNGPHQLRASGSPFTGIQSPQVIRSTETTTIGNTKVYGTAQAESADTEKKESSDS